MNYVHLLLISLASAIWAPRFLKALLEQVVEDGTSETMTELPLQVLVWAKMIDTLKPNTEPIWSAISRLGEPGFLKIMLSYFNGGDTDIGFWRSLSLEVPGNVLYNLNIQTDGSCEIKDGKYVYLEWASFRDGTETCDKLVNAIQRHVTNPLYVETLLSKPHYSCKLVCTALDDTWAGYYTKSPQQLGWEKEGVATYDDVPAMHIQYADPSVSNETVSFQEIHDGSAGPMSLISDDDWTLPMSTLYLTLRNYYNIS